jgi:hypothetical protein
VEKEKYTDKDFYEKREKVKKWKLSSSRKAEKALRNNIRPVLHEFQYGTDLDRH